MSLSSYKKVFVLLNVEEDRLLSLGILPILIFAVVQAIFSLYIQNPLSRLEKCQKSF